jgi:hypothetical protein
MIPLQSFLDVEAGIACLGFFKFYIVNLDSRLSIPSMLPSRSMLDEQVF